MTIPGPREVYVEGGFAVVEEATGLGPAGGTGSLGGIGVAPLAASGRLT